MRNDLFKKSKSIEFLILMANFRFMFLEII